MEKERKGCLIGIVALSLMGLGIFFAYEYNWPYLRNLSIMQSCMIGSYIGNTYLRHKTTKQTPKKHWVLYFLAIFVLAGIFTWIECNAK